ncbi:hypothetical protein BTW08_16420 [Salinicola sp. MH3R3-1]|uniref:hypothetical protein n=1 Tax=Salinicola sp. MH3R3-1 TaxID=1928762 RepID=UPI00094EF238|nr:hypothetical protein [Salinicola sp. MH3R3-1]OLO06601.1 hypothetical protein BTW08_16420 [Salinicola sp. MH3R3-1]
MPTSLFKPRIAALLVALLCWSGSIFAAPTPFTAHYQLDISGWPDATITHQLSRVSNDSHPGGGWDNVWESTMRASIKVASGEERGQFELDGDRVQAIDYTSAYSLVGIGDEYHLDQSQLQSLPDRQTALFELSRKAPDARCASTQVSPCELDYQNHKGKTETLYYRVTDRGDIDTPAGTFPGVTVDTWDPEKRDRHLYFTFHREIPALLLKMRYVKEGEERSHLTLTDLTLDRPNDATGSTAER